jgi:RNA polymerase sigma-70 factor (ECF subfamily)
MSSAHSADPSGWVDLYADFLFNYAAQRLPDKDIARDIVQETFLAALQAFSSYQGKSSQKTWLLGILKNKIADYYRADSSEHNYMQNLPFEENSPFHPEHHEFAGHWRRQTQPVDWGNNPLELLERDEFRRIFEACFGRLPHRTATAFRMKEIEDCNSHQICTELDLTESNLWVILHRARMHLRHCLEMKWFRNHQ